MLHGIRRAPNGASCALVSRGGLCQCAALSRVLDMTSLSDASRRSRAELGFGLAVAVIGALTVARLIALTYSEVDLFFDEAQYWAWSRELAFGYYTKPPLLAWIIALSERICGSSEACVRAPAPILYFGTSLVVYAIAAVLYDRRVAFFSALALA